MSWKASSVMEERPRFVARLLDGEAMTDVCRDFGISRKTGYKIFDRYREHGLAALSDRSRRPVRFANQLPQQVEELIVRLKAEKPHWDAREIRELLVRRLDGDITVPAKSTIHAVLDRHGLVKRGGGPRHRARGTALSEGAAPNDLWCAAPGAGRCGAFGRQRWRQLRQRTRRNDQRSLQGGGQPSTRAGAQLRGGRATLEWVDWFNNRRLLEPIGNIPPAEAEERYYAMKAGLRRHRPPGDRSNHGRNDDP